MLTLTGKREANKPEIRLKFAIEVEEGKIIIEESHSGSDIKHPNNINNNGECRTTNLDKTDEAAVKTIVTHSAVIQRTGSNQKGSSEKNTEK